MPQPTLTPTLSRKREREQYGSLTTVLGGEGWGEGAAKDKLSFVTNQVVCCKGCD